MVKLSNGKNGSESKLLNEYSSRKKRRRESYKKLNLQEKNIFRCIIPSD